MPRRSKDDTHAIPALAKTPTGITGFDKITQGGLPSGRPTLICGAAGSGKTLFSVEFIVRGALEFGEPGVIIAFEENPEEITLNVSSLGFDLKKLQKENLIHIDHIHIDRSEIEETGEYDLSGLFIRLEHAIDKIGAKRIVLDTIENLFSGLNNQAVLRAEIRRLFGWLKQKGVTAVITGEKGEGNLTRHGLEEYVSDCVILLEHRVSNQISTRIMRIIKYRGSVHGTNEYPFLIDEDGFSVMPVTSMLLEKEVSSERVSSGIPALDDMLGGEGFFRGSTILVSGTAGTGKTSIAGYFAKETCKRGERCIYFAFEESPNQIIRNMNSIGIDLQSCREKGLLEIHSARPTLHGLEMHLVSMYKKVKKFKPQTVIVDPITNLVTIGSLGEVKSMLMRLVDFLMDEGITALFTSLTSNSVLQEQTDEGISSLVDAWLLVRDIEMHGERNRGLHIMKARGMKHSNQVREFVITDAGLNVLDVYLGSNGVLIGSAREEHMLNEETELVLRNDFQKRKDVQIARKRKAMESKIELLRDEFESMLEELDKTYVEDDLKRGIRHANRQKLSSKRTNTNEPKK